MSSGELQQDVANIDMKMLCNQKETPQVKHYWEVSKTETYAIKENHEHWFKGQYFWKTMGIHLHP